jgi:hypothetical protein
MARRGIAAFGLGVTAGAAALTLATGLLPGTGPGRTGLTGSVSRLLTPPAAAADELPPFAGCAQLRRWYVDAALPQVGPWGFGPQVMPYGAAASSPVDRVAGLDTAVGSSGTGTNVQEAGVDEPDVAKTNGRFVVRVQGRDLVLTDVRGDRPRALARLRLPGRMLNAAELLLVGDTVLVLGNEPAFWGAPIPLEGRIPGPAPIGPIGQDSGVTRMIGVDVSDPTAPRVTSDQRIDGSLVSAREYDDGTVRAVVSIGYPALDFVYPNRDRTRRQARQQNRRIVRRAGIDRWLPSIRTSGSLRRPLLACTDVRHPVQRSGFGTLSVLTFPGSRPAAYTATAVTAAGDLVYSSADRLYVATTTGAWWGPPRTGTALPRFRTRVHAFAVDGATTRYVATGTVPGTVKDRWSFSEYDGRLRVAAAVGRGWEPRHNGVFVLAENGDRLGVVGRLTGLGEGERIQSVRWFDDLAVVVTFRQIDPLYTIDLADPTDPRLLGALKVPGYSEYLHPVGDHVLLGLGQDATSRGATRGAQAALFDLRDTGRVRRTGRMGFGPRTQLTVGWDPRTFTYLPQLHVAVTAVQHDEGGARMVALRLGPGGELHEEASWRLHGWVSGSIRTLPLGGHRLALVGHDVRIVRVR